MGKLEKRYCSGCHACYSICPQTCISMCADEDGFLYPKVNEDMCTQCGLCEKVCPIDSLSKLDKVPMKVYAAINNDLEVRLKSSSGGVFCLLAEYVISQGGVVFGAKFNEDFRVVHDGVEDIEGIQELCGSKYVQSEIGTAFIKVKNFLEKGRLVFFTGTPCQIVGLKAFLGKENDNLWAADLLCHGVPSPKVWEKYILYQEKQQNADVQNVSFRNKKFGWEMFSMHFGFSNQSVYEKIMLEDMYMQGFLKNVYLRTSCYNCKFKGESRFGDISLGDFWGVTNFFPDLKDDNGVSLVLINSCRGKKMFDAISEFLETRPTSMEALTKYNSCAVESVIMHPQRKDFFKDMDKLNPDELFIKYCGDYCKNDTRVKLGLIERRIEENHNCISQAIKDFFSNIDGGIYLWGSGTYGILMSKYLHNQGIKVNAFIDNNKDKIGQVIDGIPIISFSDLGEVDMDIFVSVASFEVSISIETQIHNKYPGAKVMTFDSLYGYGEIEGLKWA